MEETTKEETTHTPTPWFVGTDEDCLGREVTVCAGGENIGIQVASLGYLCPAAKANGEFIVRAVNSHQALLDALEAARHELVTLHNLTVSDVRHAGEGEWVTDTSAVVAQVDAALGKVTD